MAENGNEIDKLYLDIKVEDDNSSKKINSVAKAIDNLQKSLKGLDSVKSQLASLQNLFTGLSKSVSKTPKMPTSPKTNIPKYIDVTPPTIGGNSGGLPKIKGVDRRESLEETEEEVEQLSVQVNNLNDKTKKASVFWGKLIKSIGRIALYRLIRSALKGIASAAKEGLENLRSTNTELNTSLNGLSASATSLKNSFATALIPIIKAVEPLMTRISDTIARFSNRMAEANAAINGQSYYTKILTSDAEKYQEQLEKINKENGKLLEFDTFKTLAKQNDYTGTEEAAVGISADEAKEVVASLNMIKVTLVAIAASLTAIAAIKITTKIKDVVSSLKLATTATNGLKSSIGGIDVATKALAALGITMLIKGIADLITGWKDMGTTAKWLVPIIAVLAGAIATLVAITTIAKGNWVKALSLGAVATGVGLSVGTAIATRKFADGGSFNTADLFYANENGKTELIASSNNGGAVMNMEQLQSAIYNGMIMAMADSGSKEIVLNVNKDTLGRVVAQSTGFINTTNRRNPGLNLI